MGVLYAFDGALWLYGAVVEEGRRWGVGIGASR